MVTGDYQNLFVVIATSAATLIGLLFVAMSVSGGRARRHPQVIRDFRAAAALYAFTNAFTVSMFGLVPRSNIGYPAAIVAFTGLVFTAAGLRTTLSVPTDGKRPGGPFILIVGLVVVLGFQLFYGIELISDAHHHSVESNIGDILIASLLIGIGRSWELVGDRDTGLFSSLGVLFGHDPTGPGRADRADDPDDEGDRAGRGDPATDAGTASVAPPDR